MSLTLKRDPEWLETHQQADANHPLALLIGHDGCQVSVPVALLLAASPLVRSISAVLLPPAISPVALSVPGVAGDVLMIVVEMMMKGTSYNLNAEQIKKVSKAFEVLGCGAVLNSYNLECCEIKVEVKYEKTINAFEIDEVVVTSTNDYELEEKNNCSVIEQDIKVKLNSKSDKFESKPLRAKKAKRKIKARKKYFQCDECEYETLLKNRFHRHVRIHTGEKPFECDQCEYRAIQYSDLKKHKRIHTGEKPFVCDQCDYKCSASSSRLIKHKRVVHKVEKPFKCDLCEYKAKKWRELITHNRLHK